MIAVVIPSYRVRNQILSVIDRVGREVELIFVVDDMCPEKSGEYVKEKCRDSRVRVLFHQQNSGVGGAVKSGYEAAIKAGASVIVKIDGDGQLDPALISHFVMPILSGSADYVKGNRFYSWELVSTMPKVRFAGNSGLSFISKLVSGYWSVMDPTNGYTAISAKIAEALPLKKINNRYFFESDMLFRLGTLRAKVIDMPMQAIYRDEPSSLSALNSMLTFPPKFVVRFLKRIIYNYFIRDFNIASLYILFGPPLLIFGVVFGITTWIKSTQVVASSGTVMLAALPTIIGFQMLVQFISYDILMEPKEAVHPLLKVHSNDASR